MSALSPTSRLQAAAWVPDGDPERPWDEAADVAADWIWDRSRTEGVRPILVTNSLQSVGIESLDAIARTGGQATPRSRRPRGHQPVLAYVPHEASLKLALDVARGYSLVVVETEGFPLAEWAAGVAAVNLLDGTTSSSELDGEVLSDLDRVVFFGGNNGWTGPHEKEHASRQLVRYVSAGRLTPAQAAAYVMSKGVSHKGAARLRALLEK